MGRIRSVLKSVTRSLGVLDEVRFLRDITYNRLATSRLQYEAMLGFYGRFISAGDICVDVGANIGNRTRVFLDLGATVIALEPQPYCTRVLRAKFGRTARFSLVEKAAGAATGVAEMALGDGHTTASLSRAWRDRTVASGRWNGDQWIRTVTVDVTTLDRVIHDYGLPKFCKIDVEGFELDVLKGLSSAIGCISFEFTAPECSDQAIACVDRLSELGDYIYNYSRSENMELVLSEWVPASLFKEVLSGIQERNTWGDVYARLSTGSRP